MIIGYVQTVEGIFNLEKAGNQVTIGKVVDQYRMCGIAGIVSGKKRPDLDKMLDKMLEAIIHRGPDGQGKKIFDEKVALGHRRLAIIDLSENGLQPMQWRKRYWITFNGEIFNYRELRKQLQKEYKYQFNTETDTEVILAAFDVWGNDCVKFFNGMWAFAIYDTKENKLFCSRDRYGVKPFYYSFSEDFLFGSEIKEILKLYKNQAKANKKNLEAFLVRGLLDINNETMFDGILQLEGGCNLILDCESLEYNIERWHELRNIKLNSYGKRKNCKIFREKFETSVKLRLHADVPIGSCLSGGLDSSAIVCMANYLLRNEKEPFQQYTITSCFHNKKYDEQEYADAVSEQTGVISYKIYPDLNKFFDEIDYIIWHMDEPFVSMSMYAQWSVFKKAKSCGLKVMLDGQGADEQLAGYTPFYNVLFFDLLKKGKVCRLKRELKEFRAGRAETDHVSTAERILSLTARWIIPEKALYKLKIFYNNIKSELPFDTKMYFNEVILNKEKVCDAKNDQHFVFGNMYTGMRALLHYEDRDSMAHSIEARVPFLDADLSEFIFSVPISEKIENGKTKDILRESIKELLPDKVYSRYDKMGFVTPQESWIDENQEFFSNEFQKACEKLKNIINKEKLLNWYKNNYKKNPTDVSNVAFRVICAAHWADVFCVEI